MEGFKLFEYIKWFGISFLVVSSYLFLGGYHVGPLSLRLLVSYGLLGYALSLGTTKYQPTKGIKMYFVYLAAYIFISVLNFSAFRACFVKNLFVYFIVSCSAIVAFPKLFKTKVSIWTAYIVLVFIFLLNAFVTYLQYIDSPLGWSIGMYINPAQIEELGEIQFQLNKEEGIQAAILMGIMGNPVSNGYFVATILPVVTCYVWDKFGLKTAWTAIMFVIAGFCVFVIQQRMALIVTAFYVVTIFALKEKNVKSLVFMIITVIVLLKFFQGIDISEFGRLGTVEEDEDRMGTLEVLGDLLSDPVQVLLGYQRVGDYIDLYVFRTIGHNTILDALRRGGIFLMLIYIVLFFRLCKELVEIVRFSRRVKDYRTLGMALGCICYLLYSQTHSAGVQSGGIMFWTLFMLTIQSHRVECASHSNPSMQKSPLVAYTKRK